MFDSFFNTVLGPVMNLPDPLNLFIISFILTAIITLIYKWMTDQEVMKSLKQEMKGMQKEIKALKDKPEKMMQMQKQAMEKNMKYMMKSFKPMLVTFIPIIIVFGWLRNYYTALGNPEVFFGLTWIWTYIIFSLVLSIVIRRILKVH